MAEKGSNFDALSGEQAQNATSMERRTWLN